MRNIDFCEDEAIDKLFENEASFKETFESLRNLDYSDKLIITLETHDKIVAFLKRQHCQ